MSEKTIQPNSKVVMHYRIILEDGTVADSTWEDNEPIAFVHGDGTLAPGLEEVLIGLQPGARESIPLAPEQGFGHKDTENIHTLSRSDFGEDTPVAPGLVIGFTLPNGQELPGMIIEVEGDQVLVDFNHPFSGHQLSFEVEILSVE